jgi:uncharacterized paraquat-inducible protein A
VLVRGVCRRASGGGPVSPDVAGYVAVAVISGAFVYTMMSWEQPPEPAHEQPFDPGSVSVSPSHQEAREREREAKALCAYCDQGQRPTKACTRCGAPLGPKQYGPAQEHPGPRTQCRRP